MNCQMIFQLSIEGSTSVRVLFYLRSRVFPKIVFCIFSSSFKFCFGTVVINYLKTVFDITTAL